jgi:hypothetical protein
LKNRPKHQQTAQEVHQNMCFFYFHNHTSIFG